jgi:CRISPR/Cas system-associated exonuclease Cas4 (RecB family)
MEELANQREQAVTRRFEHEIEQRVAEVSRRVGAGKPTDRPHPAHCKSC